MTAETEIATREDQEAPAPATQADALISVIERAAMNPNVDIDKMERLLQMQERVMSRQAQAEYTTAMARMQPELPIVEERGAIKGNDNKVRNTYAKWEDINEQIKPVLARHGFALTFRTERMDDSRMVVVAQLSHEGGHSEETASPPLPADTSGNKNAIQALGSSVSYGKRYSAAAILNLTSRGEDDDGRAGGAKSISEEQFTTLRKLLDDSGADEDAFLRYFGAQSLNLFPATKFAAAEKMLRRKQAEAKGGGNG